MKNEVPTELQFSGTGVTDNSINQMNDNQSILTLKQYDMVIFIDDHKSIATDGGNQTDIDK